MWTLKADLAEFGGSSDRSDPLAMGLSYAEMRVLCKVFVEIITGSAVALQYCNGHSKINWKIENSTECSIATFQNFSF